MSEQLADKLQFLIWLFEAVMSSLCAWGIWLSYRQVAIIARLKSIKAVVDTTLAMHEKPDEHGFGSAKMIEALANLATAQAELIRITSEAREEAREHSKNSDAIVVSNTIALTGLTTCLEVEAANRKGREQGLKEGREHS